MARAKTMEGFQPLEKSRAEWKKLLPADRYAILFQASTERSFSRPFNGEKRPGTFICAACFLPLFSSEAKFESGTGWPSFFQALPGRVATKRDFKLLLPRTEYHCARCGGHQDHVYHRTTRRGTRSATSSTGTTAGDRRLKELWGPGEAALESVAAPPLRPSPASFRLLSAVEDRVGARAQHDPVGDAGTTPRAGLDAEGARRLYAGVTLVHEATALE